MPLGVTGILDRLLKWVVVEKRRRIIREEWTWLGVEPPTFTQLVSEPWTS